MDRIINIGIYSTLFLSSIVLFKSPFEFYISYIPILVLLPFFIAKYPFPTKLLYLFLPLLVFGLVSVFFGQNTMGDFFKIFINIVISSIFFYYVFLYYDKDVYRIFGIYMRVCVWVSALGLIQLVSYWVGFKLGYDYRMIGFNKWSYVQGGLGLRINSVFSEPSYFGATIGPAFFVAIYNLLFRQSHFINIRQAAIIIVAYFLTFSTVAYMGVFMVLLLLLINYGLVRYALLVVPLAFVVFSFMYNNVDEFRIRLDALKALYIDDVLETKGLKQGEKNLRKQHELLEVIHGSSFVQYNNYVIASSNFMDHPFFGTGLGSHKMAFEKYNILDKLGDNIYDFNNSDANSMFLRLMSETGLFGLLFIILFIRKFFIKIPEEPAEGDLTWLISNATLVMIILQLARQGNYTYNGFFFYMWLYYFTYQKFNESASPEEDTEAADSTPAQLPGQPGTGASFFKSL